MKSIVYILIAIFGGSILFTALPQNTTKQNKTITIQCVDNQYSAIELEKSAEIIQSRLNGFETLKAKATANIDEGTIDISLKGNIDAKNLTSLIFAKGKIEFYETINRSSIIDKLENDKKLSEFLGIVRIDKDADDYSGVFGYCAQSNFTKATQLLQNLVVKKADENLRFCWSETPNEKGEFTLHLLTHKAILDKSSIEFARVEILEQSNRPELLINFDERGAKKWHEITKQNIGKNITIVLDNFVLQSPKVMSEISGGKATISGNFTKEELKRISVLINNDEVPLNFQMKK